MLLTGLVNILSYRTQVYSSPTLITNLKRYPYKLAYSLTLWEHILIWSSLLSNDFSVCQVGIKLASIALLSMMTW